MRGHFQLFPNLILLICAWLIPYSLANDFCSSPKSNRNLIQNTSSLESNALPFFSPEDERNLPLEIISLMLSGCVPSKRCSGFTQAGLSQRWQAHGFGKAPKAIAKDNRWASMSLSRSRKTPYPCSFRYLFHSQQLSPFSTFFQNLAMSFSVKTIDDGEESDVNEVSITRRIFRHSVTRVKRGMRFFFI